MSNHPQSHEETIPFSSPQVMWGEAETEQQLIREIMSTDIASPKWLMFRYLKPAVILGTSQKKNSQVIDRAEQHQIPLVKRKSGGGAVIAGEELLSVSVFLPANHPISKNSTIAAYEWICELWIAAMNQLGIATQAPSKEQMTHSQLQAENQGTDWACYGQVAHGELVTEEQRKFLGVAQIRTRYGCALTCGVYFRPPDWALLAQIMNNQPEQASILSLCNASVQCLANRETDNAIKQLPQVLHDHLTTAVQVN